MEAGRGEHYTVFVLYGAEQLPVDVNRCATATELLYKALLTPGDVSYRGLLLAADDLLSDIGIGQDCMVEYTHCGCRRNNKRDADGALHKHECIHFCKMLGCSGSCGRPKHRPIIERYPRPWAALRAPRSAMRGVILLRLGLQ